MVPRSSQVTVLHTEQQSVGDEGRLGVSGWERSGDRKRNPEPRNSLLLLLKCSQDLGLGIRKVKSGEGQTPRQKEE